MGYYSNFSLSVLNADELGFDEDRKIFAEIEEKCGYRSQCDGEYYEDIKWYDMKKDVAFVAKKHPKAIIEVTRDGEDSDDYVVTRFKGNLMETVEYEMKASRAFSEIVVPEDTVVEGKLSLSDEKLQLLRDVIHEYKDCNCGDKDRIHPVMELEATLCALTGGRYEPDTTYSVK